ncbi:MAG TPA: hypothetical protein VGQ26_03120 [Streptosporangiaceae bacterium]|nr:hypothetical protein [Streptosporangiaceae bacterium]
MTRKAKLWVIGAGGVFMLAVITACSGPASAPPGSTPAAGTASTSAAATASASPAATHAVRHNARHLGPVATVRAYFKAINRHHYGRAWRLGGRNTGGSYAAFVSGFEDTEHDTVTIQSVSGNVVRARLAARQTDGSVKTYEGTYRVSHGVITGFHVAQVFPAGTSGGGCHPKASTGNCYEPGEFCPHADAGMSGVAGNGKAIICEENNGLRWEPA